MKKYFYSETDNATWLFDSEKLTATGTGIIRGKLDLDTFQHKNEQEFKGHLNTIKKDKRFVEIK